MKSRGLEVLMSLKEQKLSSLINAVATNGGQYINKRIVNHALDLY